MSSPDSVLRSISQVVLSSDSVDWSAKKKRGFHRILSGLTRARYRGDKVRFMTLTTSIGGSFELLRRHFQLLRRRIERKFGFKLEYFSIRTNEGNGVLHIVFKGGFVPQKWLSNVWSLIHGAHVVDIRALHGKSKRVANYLIGHYLSRQTFERMSWSWGWVFRGFCGVWRSDFASSYRSNPRRCLFRWNRLICTFSPPSKFHYGSLSGG